MVDELDVDEVVSVVVGPDVVGEAGDEAVDSTPVGADSDVALDMAVDVGATAAELVRGSVREEVVGDVEDDAQPPSDVEPTSAVWEYTNTAFAARGTVTRTVDEAPGVTWTEAGLADPAPV